MTNTPTTGTAEAAPPESDDRLSPRDRLVITILLISAFVVILNETIMGVALPQLMKDLGITASTGQWLTTAFLLTMAVVIPITGLLLQRFKTRPVFMTAMILFSTGTLVSAMSLGFPMLLIGRVIQASGTAIMMPLLMTTVMTLVAPASRGRIMGTISIVISVAPALGPTISGIILNALNWRWLFWLVLPIAIAALLFGALRIPNVTETRLVRVDILSVVLSALAFGGLVYGLSTIGAAANGGAAMSPWIPLAIGSVAMVIFLLRQTRLQKTDEALLDLRTFSSSTFSLSVGMMALSMIGLFGTIILLPIYMQTVLQLEPITTGLLLLPGGLIMGLLGPVVGRIYDKHGPRVLLIPGSIVVSTVLWCMTMLTENTPFMWILAAHVSLSIGLALMFTPLFTAGLGSVKPAFYSYGSAIIGTAQQVAGAAGTALFITVMSVQTAALVAKGQDVIPATAGGIHAAFVCGAILSLLPVVGSFFVRKPEDDQEAVPAH
ncbi:DHA2 family efflux MFS transporter permease subunit [Klugiella xanthotipulae]|uniref:DHA2 family lincomycin resistance protein-like MFS transporter n=1 Tax=Klugiella xanthotipulae TaxID=244735 RepID=A0A543I4E0_9MICO|nr:DHA2 family efflux MFS transporter permease subunit [Klugiella xanthotipulae]TQM65466.1 DHA2 family lincomycin resistance protein-like MFS transporter [Klugiella xanthotipulae]